MVSRIDFIESGEHIKACQWVQEEKGKLKILVVPDIGFSEKDSQFVYNETVKRIGENNMDIAIQVVPLQGLIYSRRGKFKLIVNKLHQHS